MGATTFAELITNPVSEKVFLAEVKPAEHLQGWTVNGTYADVFQMNYLNEMITLADGTTETIRKAVVAVEEDGSAYTAKTSLADVHGTASTFWHDTTNGVLYAHASDGGTPDDFTMVAYFWLYFATKGIILDTRYYEPYIAEGGIPQISQSTSEIHWGVAQISIGSVVLLNGRGYFDQISLKLIWHNKTIRILMGGDSLPYAEYTVLFTGRIVKPLYTKQTYTLGLRSNAYDLFRTLPVNNYWTSTWANLDPAMEGKPIPIAYGSYNAVQAPLATCINTAYGTNVYQFKICDCTYWPIKSITQVYIDYGDGNGWQNIAHANEDLTNATFTITSTSFVVGTTRVAVAFEGYHNSGTLIEGCPEVVEDILTKWCGYASAALNSTSFTSSKSLSDSVINVFVSASTAALTIIENICKSDLAYFDEDGDGLLRYRTWEPSQTGTIPTLDAFDILDENLPQVEDDTDALYWKVSVGYSYCPIDKTYLYAEGATEASKYKYGKSEVLTHETYLRTAANAQTLAERLNWITSEPSPALAVLLKAAQIDKILGDKMKITLARAPCATAGGYDERVFEIIGKNLSCFPVKQSLTMRDLAEFGKDVGFWMGDSAPAWADATQQERDDSGFWSDSGGYVVTGDETTHNKSKWW